jgi:V/A-type H+-transporting ATPase subunit I
MRQRMENVLVIGPKKDHQNIIDVLYQEGTIHLQNASIAQYHGLFNKMELVSLDELTSVLMKINGIYQILPRVPDDEAEQKKLFEELRWKNTAELVQIAEDGINELETRTRKLASRKSDLELDKTTLERYEKILDKIQPLENQLPLMEGFEVTVLLIQREFKEVLDLITPILKNITHNQFEFISADLDETTTAAITVFNKKYSEQVHSFLFSQNVNEIRIPKDYANMPLQDALNKISLKKLEIDQEMKDIDTELSALSSRYYQQLFVFKRLLEDREEEVAAFSKFGQSENTILIKGWIPKKFIKRTKKALQDAFGDRVVLTRMDVEPEELEEAPIFYDNPWWVRPFEFFTQLVSPPRYLEVDPSPVFAIFFPIFFGIIVGDIGYGLCILGFGLVMKRLFRELVWMQQLMNILIISSIPTIFFGFLFGEFFGDFGEHMGWIHPITFLGITWNRVEAMIPLLIVAIAIGVIHVFLGLGIGILNAYAKKSKKHLFEKIGTIGVLSGILILVGTLIGVIPEVVLIPSIVVILVSLPMVIYGGGVLGAIEIMSSIGNILSYARIMAIGMASVILAMVANQLGGAMEVVAIGVLIAILLHSLNVILAMFSPSIHSMRLHIVEFYSKFYEGGGEMYKPFGRN